MFYLFEVMGKNSQRRAEHAVPNRTPRLRAGGYEFSTANLPLSNNHIPCAFFTKCQDPTNLV
jgi:hypothetical protein